MMIFRLFKRYPPLGIVACAALFYFVSFDKMKEEGRLHGYFGGAQTFQAAVVDRYETRGRRGIRKCHVKARAADKLYDVAAECDNWDRFVLGAPIELVAMSDGVQSLDFMKGHFYIDLGLVALELLGFIYFSWLFVAGAKEPQPEPS
jgi:hypothetical protein